MNINQLSVALYTIIYKEVRRFMRIWPQTLLPPAITMSLYFVIFGNLVGSSPTAHREAETAKAHRG